MRHSIRTGAVWLVLAAFGAAAVGLPMPSLVLNPTGEAYPCAAHGCGCHSAENCWRNCCCHTPAQRLAWAKRNNVIVPPEWLPAPIVAAVSMPASAKQSCCQQRSSCEQRGAQTSSPEAQPASSETLVWYSAIAARQCQGQGNLWAVVGASLPPPIQISWAAEWPLVAQAATLYQVASGEPAQPPIPPPRRA
ncbi:MAG: hypothetical protein JSS27_12995 [Planctomycetes bacterium]|nr:hypothetical protein [Planctomycetota bacterium]